MIRDLAKVSSKYFSGLLTSKVLSTFIVIFIARILAPSQFGQYTFFLTSIYIFAALAQVGLSLHYQKTFHSRNAQTLLNEIYQSQLVTLVIAIFVGSIIFISTQTFTPVILIIWILGFIFHTFGELSRGYYLAHKKPSKISFKQALESAIMVIPIAYLGDSLNFFTSATWITIGFFISMTILTPWKQIHLKFVGFEKIKKTISSSYVYGLLILTSLVYARGDQFAIKYILTDSALGYYSVAYRFLDALSMLPNAIAHNLFPLSAKKDALSKEQLVKLTLYMGIIGLLISIPLFILSKFIIGLLFGSAYYPATVLLQIFAGVLFMLFINAPLSTIVQSSSLVKSFLPYGIANTLANIFLNVIFLPVYGIQAAALIMLVTEVSGCVINIKFVRKVYS